MNKNIFSKLLLMAAVTLGVWSCTQDEFEGGSKPNKPVTGDVLHIEVANTLAGGDGMAVTRSTYSTSGGTVREYFEEGDQIGVYGLNGSTLIADNICFTLDGEGNWNPPTGVDVPYSQDYVFYAYYPYKASLGACTFDNSTPSDISAGEDDDTNSKFAAFIDNWPIATNQSDEADFRASDLLAARGVNQSIPVVRFTMAHKMAMVEFVPTYNYVYYAWNTESNARQPMAVQFTGSNQPYELDGNFYYLMRPGVATNVSGQTYSASSGKFYYKRFSSITGSYTLSYSTNNGSSWSSSAPSWLSVEDYDNGSSYKNLKISYVSTSHAATGANVGTSKVSGTYDLSTHDVNGKATTRNTANCYMIHQPGTYSLPIVYGNAIKNGNTNTEAFQPYGGSGTDFLYNFQNASDEDITTPYLIDNGETPASAAVIWSEGSAIGSIVTSPSISGDKKTLTFTVPDNAPYGNALVAVKDASGHVLWSWHIWTCPDWYSPQSMVPISTGTYTYDVAPVNLGWVGSFDKKIYAGGSVIIKMTPSNSEEQEQFFTVELPSNTEEYIATSYGHCPYYQWGRKDPEQPSNGNANSVLTVQGTALSHTSASVSFGTTIKNPTVHYYNSGNNGPYATNEYNLWDAHEWMVTNSSNYAGHTVKTVYDPCPPGYVVPRGNLYAYITNSGTQNNYGAWDGTNFIRTWTRNFPLLGFPAAGYRGYSSGTSIGNVASYGYCWSSSANSSTNARYLRLDGPSYFCWFDGNRAYGLAVRPVAEIDSED